MLTAVKFLVININISAFHIEECNHIQCARNNGRLELSGCGVDSTRLTGRGTTTCTRKVSGVTNRVKRRETKSRKMLGAVS